VPGLWGEGKVMSSGFGIHQQACLYRIMRNQKILDAKLNIIMNRKFAPDNPLDKCLSDMDEWVKDAKGEVCDHPADDDYPAS
jgi:plasmid rolling circle replication initiator protein Rep